MVLIRLAAAARQATQASIRALGFTPRLTRWLPAAVLVVAMATPAAAQHPTPRPLSQALAQRALTQSATTFEREFVDLLTRNRQPEALAGALRQTLVQLRDHPPTPAGRWLVDYLRAAPALVLAPHPERAAVLHDPYGLTAVAEGTHNAWIWQDWRRQIIESGQTGEWQQLEELKRLSGAPAQQAAIRGAAAGLRELPPETLAHPQLKMHLENSPALAPLTLAVVELTGDAQLLQNASERWPQGERAALSLKLASLLGTEKALAAWRRQLTDAGPLQPFARQAVTLLAQQPGLSPEQANKIQQLLEEHP
ncbi:MAG: hypothetical protein AAGB27_05940 [Pseudomonadota bacterium]